MTPPAPLAPTVDAIILAGGGSRRLGGIDKPALTVGGTPLVQRALDAVADCRRVVLVGPHRDGIAPNIRQAQETPPGAGPVAAMAAGLAALGTPAADVVVVLAADLPFVDSRAVTILVDAALTDPAVFAADDEGRIQYLLAAWNTEALHASLDSIPTKANASVRTLVPTDHRVIQLDDIADCDTVDDLRNARRRWAAAVADRPALDLDTARADIRRTVPPLSPRTVPATEALGATLAEPVVARAPLPPVDISAMDGYAVAGDSPWVLRPDVAYAGTTNLPRLEAGEALRIATGAAVPAGTTGVIRDEHIASVGDNTIARSPDAPVRDDRRRRGEDWAEGTELLPAGVSVSAAVMSVALAAEVPELSVRGPVRARIVLSGNEIETGGPLNPGRTRDTLGPVLPHYLRACGVDVVDTVHLPDTPTAFNDALANFADVDLLVVVGATGGGAADRLRSALTDADATTVVGRVNIRPGGSQITAILPFGPVVVGLPGNPLAAVCTSMTIVPALVDALTVRTPAAARVGSLDDAGAVRAAVTRVVPVTSRGTSWTADAHPRTAHLLSLTSYEALAVVPPDVSDGGDVEIVLLPQ
ncbi:MAG: NTP transferase domain-containing protein [Rhodococcus sp. (in: high G+C Gram-positive bacteria)]